MKISFKGDAPGSVTVADLKPGDTFRRVCAEPHAVYTVLRFENADKDKLHGTWVLADLTNNRCLPWGHIPVTSQATLLRAEVTIQGVCDA